MSSTTLQRPLTYAEERGKPCEETFHTGTAKDPVTGLTAQLEEVFS